MWITSVEEVRLMNVSCLLNVMRLRSIFSTSNKTLTSQPRIWTPSRFENKFQVCSTSTLTTQKVSSVYASCSIRHYSLCVIRRGAVKGSSLMKQGDNPLNQSGRVIKSDSSLSLFFSQPQANGRRRLQPEEPRTNNPLIS